MTHVRIIEANSLNKYYLKELWQARELIYLFAWRDILVKYKQTVIGILWALIRPVLTILIFTIIFQRLANLPSEGVPYILLVFAGLLPWQFFATSTTEASNSLISNQQMIKKVYFPRLVLPIAVILTNLVDVAILLGLFVLMMLYYKIVPTLAIFALPLMLLHVTFLSTALGTLLAGWTVCYRDFRYITPFIIQIGMYLSPVGFSSAVVPEKWQLLFSMNPLVGIIEGFRFALLGTECNFISILISWLWTLFFMLLAFFQFRKFEHRFDDVL